MAPFTGEIDPVVNFKYGKMTAELLKPVCPLFEFKAYKGMGHSSSPQVSSTSTTLFDVL